MTRSYTQRFAILVAFSADRRNVRCYGLLLHVAPISIALSHFCFRLLPAIGGKGAANGDLFLEFALLITPQLPSIAGMRLDQGSLTIF